MPRLGVRWRVVAAWLVLCVVGFGPDLPQRPDLTDWLWRLLTGRWAGEAPWGVAHFQWMGLWPPLIALQLADRWRARPVPAWPFLLASVGLGMYALLPWFAIAPTDPGPPGPRWTRSRTPTAVLLAVGIALALWAAATDDLFAYLRQVPTDGVLWPMAVDWVAFATLWWALARTPPPSPEPP